MMAVKHLLESNSFSFALSIQAVNQSTPRIEMRKPMTFCPACHQNLDAARALVEGKQQPPAGDVSVCRHCGEFLEYADALQVHRLAYQTLDAKLLAEALADERRRAQEGTE